MVFRRLSTNSVAAPTSRTTTNPARQSRHHYQCPHCETRYLGEQRCPDCNTWCQRLGPGGPCPHCDELVAVSDLIADNQFRPTPLHNKPKTP